jgi:exodeoxyribonuclease-5
VELSVEQRGIYNKVLAGRAARPVQTVGGYAGTGKTVLLGALSAALPSYAVCAYTGKAAHVLRRKGVDAQTIHSTIYVPVDNAALLCRLRQQLEALRRRQAPPEEVRAIEAALEEAKRPRFRLKEPEELAGPGGGRVGGFLVDESSMVSRDVFEDLCSFDRPTIFVGDHGQLPPVDGGAGFNLMERPDHTLETIHRNAGPIARFAEHLRKGGRPARWGGNGEAVRVVGKGAVTDRLLLSADQVIVPFNAMRVRQNARARELLGRTELLEPGDRVICLRNDRDRGLFNGQQGVVSRVSLEGGAPAGQMDLTADDGTRFAGLAFNAGELGRAKHEHYSGGPHPFDYGYVVTCHKAQGSEWPHVLVFEGWCPYWEHQRWAYTAASRAQERLDWAL